MQSIIMICFVMIGRVIGSESMLWFGISGKLHKNLTGILCCTLKQSMLEYYGGVVDRDVK